MGRIGVLKKMRYIAFLFFQFHLNLITIVFAVCSKKQQPILKCKWFSVLFCLTSKVIKHKFDTNNYIND